MPSEPADAPGQSRAAPGNPPAAGWLFSILIHAGVVLALVAVHFWAPPPPPATPVVFELVNVEQPRLRPVAPPTPQPPPETRRPETRPPDPPKLAPKPEQTKPEPEQKASPEPEPAPDTSLPEEDPPPETGRLATTLVANIPSDPRLAFWAGRVRRIVEAQWNPPAGIDVQGRVKTVIGFRVGRGGEISGVEVSDGTGNALLDELAMRTILRVERLPPIPESFPEDMLSVSYEFIYQGR